MSKKDKQLTNNLQVVHVCLDMDFSSYYLLALCVWSDAAICLSVYLCSSVFPRQGQCLLFLWRHEFYLRERSKKTGKRQVPRKLAQRSMNNKLRQKQMMVCLLVETSTSSTRRVKQWFLLWLCGSYSFSGVTERNTDLSFHCFLSVCLSVCLCECAAQLCALPALWSCSLLSSLQIYPLHWKNRVSTFLL